MEAMNFLMSVYLVSPLAMLPSMPLMMSAIIALRLFAGVASMIMIALLMYFCVNEVMIFTFGWLVKELYCSSGYKYTLFEINCNLLFKLISPPRWAIKVMRRTSPPLRLRYKYLLLR